MTIEELKQLTRDEKLLVLAVIEVEFEETSGSGHNTKWAETVDLVLKGRRGLFDYSDEELDSELESYVELLREQQDAKALLRWARESSGIEIVSAEKKTWETRQG